MSINLKLNNCEERKNSFFLLVIIYYKKRLNFKIEKKNTVRNRTTRKSNSDYFRGNNYQLK